jgi:DNA-binding NarL/FixJ family response regulator
MKSTPSSILIVDDSDAVRSVVRIFLERDPAFIVCGEAANGTEAIQKAQELQPDLILLDMKLPGMNGIETANALKSLLPKAKLVLFSAYIESLGGRTWAAAAGVDLVVPKGSLIDMADSLRSLAARSA